MLYNQFFVLVSSCLSGSEGRRVAGGLNPAGSASTVGPTGNFLDLLYLVFHEHVWLCESFLSSMPCSVEVVTQQTSRVIFPKTLT